MLLVPSTFATTKKSSTGPIRGPPTPKTTQVWWRKDKFQDTCAKTHNVRPGVYCKKGIQTETFEKALDICLRAGGRLCTLEEVRNGDTIGTGCNYNYKRIWTSTPCAKIRVVLVTGRPLVTRSSKRESAVTSAWTPRSVLDACDAAWTPKTRAHTTPSAEGALLELRVSRDLSSKTAARARVLRAQRK